jgi:HEAT repeat protein
MVVNLQGEQFDQFPYFAAVIAALGKIAIERPEVELAIRRQLKSKSAGRRAAALHALARPGDDSPQMLAEVVEIFKTDTEGNVRGHAALTIAGLSGDRRVAIDSLAEALGDPNPDVRKTAGMALGSMGPAAKSALPALQKAWLEARRGIPIPEPGICRNCICRSHRCCALP